MQAVSERLRYRLRKGGLLLPFLWLPLKVSLYYALRKRAGKTVMLLRNNRITVRLDPGGLGWTIAGEATERPILH